MEGQPAARPELPVGVLFQPQGRRPAHRLRHLRRQHGHLPKHPVLEWRRPCRTRHPTIAIVSPMSGAQYYNGVNTPVTVTVGNNIGPIYTPPTGTVTLTVTNIATSVVAGTYGPFNLAPIAGASKSSINTPLTGLAVGKYSIAAAYSGDTIDTSATSSVASFKAVPVIPTITWPTPSFVYVGTKLSSTQLDAAAAAFGASLPGTFVYTPPGRNSREYAGDIPAQGGLY